MKIPLAICLFTSTKGHWGVKDRYLQTIKHLNKQIPLKHFSKLVANVKYTDASDMDQSLEMAGNLEKLGFKTYARAGQWRHADQSHQNEYLNDLFHVYNLPEVLDNKYVLHLEDDWLIQSSNMDLEYYIYEAIKVLEENHDILQVRFPRFPNEFDRINGLKKKHGINARATHCGDIYFQHNDFSLNPSIFRSRDLRAASILMKKNPNAFPAHVEHGFGAALKYFSNEYDCFAAFYPEFIRAYHIGSPVGEEDRLGETLISD